MVRLCSGANADDPRRRPRQAERGLQPRQADGGRGNREDPEPVEAYRHAQGSFGVALVQDPHHGGADVGKVAADGIGPQRLQLGVPGRLEGLHNLKEVREVSCPNRAVVRYVTQCLATDEFVDLVTRPTRASGSRWISDRSASTASTERSASATASAASRVKPPTKITDFTERACVVLGQRIAAGT